MNNKNKLLKTISNEEITELLRSCFDAAVNGDKDARKLMLELYFEKPGDQGKIEVNNNFAESKLNDLQATLKHKII